MRNAYSSGTFAGTVLVEEQMKNGEVILDGRLVDIRTLDEHDNAPFVRSSIAIDGIRRCIVALRL
jgi:hypothetical protein